MLKRLFMALTFVICLLVASNTTAVAEESLDELADKIVLEYTNSNMSEYEKAVALYDYLIDHTVYRGGGGNATDPDHVLRKGEGSCGGYANTYQLLLSKAGIESKTIDGTVYTLGHTWNLVLLDGEWCHVDTRMADHFLATEDRYRRFGMSDEQTNLDYNFKKPGVESHSNYYPYKTGKLNSAITYVQSAIIARVGEGKVIFTIDPFAEGAPPELKDPYNRVLIKNVLQNFECDYPGVPGKASMTLSLKHDLFLVDVKLPTHRVETLTPTIPAEIEVEAAGGDFSTVAPLELGDKIQVEPSYATKPKLYWKSYREKTAVVDQNGTVKIVGPGKAKIKVSTTDGSKLTFSFDLSVKE